jgi:hypothetical protein
VSGGDRPLSALRTDWPSTPDFHPEFGLLCPSPRRRRGLRLAMVCVMAGMTIGATMGLAIAHWRDGDAASPPARSFDEERLTLPGNAAFPPIDIPVVPIPASASTAGADEAAAARPQGVCTDPGVKDMAAAFLNPSCGSSKSHVRHVARATYRVATVVIGRTDVTAAETAPVAVAAIEPPRAPAGVMLKSVPSTTQPIERPALPRKKVKVVTSAPIVLTPPAGEPTPQEAGFSAFAATPWPGRSDRRPADTSRAAGLQILGGW